MYSYLAKKSEAFVIGNYILKQHQLDLMEEYYENPFIGIINWPASNLEINGFACMGSLQISRKFYLSKRNKNKDIELQNNLLDANENCRFNSCFIALKSGVVCKCHK